MTPPDKLRVIVVSRWYPSPAEPLAGIFVEDQVRILREVCEVQVLVPTTAPLADLRRFLRARGALAPVARVPTPQAQIGFPLRLLACWRALSRLRLLPAEQAVVHVHLLLPDALPVLLAARLRGLPVVITEHATFLHELLRSRRARLQARLALRFADAVVAVGAALESQLLALEPRARLRTVANPLDLSEFLPADAPARDFALAVPTRLIEQKGIDVLLRAWAEAAKAVELPPLVIVGEGAERAALERLAAELEIARTTRFLGQRTRDQLAQLLQSSAFLVSSSREETFGLVVAEALACGTPVVATRTGEAARMVGSELGLLVEPGDVRGLALAIAEMARSYRGYDPQQLHEQMGRLYGAENVRRELLELYREVIGRRAGRPAAAGVAHP